MQKGIIKYTAVIWLTLLLLMGNTPMEFIHLFADHNDTVHNYHKGLVIEKKHHHCAFLSLTLDTFINDYQIPVIFFSFVEHYTAHADLVTGFVQRQIINSTLRGPPEA